MNFSQINRRSVLQGMAALGGSSVLGTALAVVMELLISG